MELTLTSWIAFGAVALLGVMYVLRRRARLNQED